MEPGQWGSCGYHYYRMTEERFVQQEMFRFFQTLKGSVKHSQVEEDKARAEAVIRAQHYIGQPVAFAQCPAYKAVIEREVSIERLRTANPLKSKRDYSERDWS